MGYSGIAVTTIILQQDGLGFEPVLPVLRSNCNISVRRDGAEELNVIYWDTEFNEAIRLMTHHDRTESQWW